MPVDVAFPDPDEEPEDERLADDDTPVEDIPREAKITGKRTSDPLQSAKLSDQMWEEYAGGLTMGQVADLHGVSRVSVWKRLRKQRARLGLEDLVEAKTLDLGRYEALIERVWQKTFQDPTNDNVRTLALLMDQRAKLLGLNAPKKLMVDGEMNLTPSPALTSLLERVQAERSKLGGGTLGRPALPTPEGDIVEAELVDDD